MNTTISKQIQNTPLYNLSTKTQEHNPTLSEIQNFLKTIKLPSITQQQLESLNEPITQEEVADMIKSLKTGKSPGPGGYSNNYYKIFSETITHKLVRLYNHWVTANTINPEFILAHMATIPKPGKATDNSANYRPIALLNTDITMYAKILANRLGPLLPELVWNDQVGFVMGKQAPDNTKKLLDILQVTEWVNFPMLLLSLDAEKALDRVNWTYMQAVLKQVGLSGNIFKAISWLYTVPPHWLKLEYQGPCRAPLASKKGLDKGAHCCRLSLRSWWKFWQR